MDSPTPSSTHLPRRTPSRQDMKIMELSASLTRARQREQTLALQLQSARTCNQSLLSDLITVTEREEALRTRVQDIEGRVLNAELDAAVYQSQLARAVEHNGHLTSLLGAGARVVERLDRQHIFELGLVEAGVAVGTVVGARQGWVEEEKTRFVGECREVLGDEGREVLLAYDPHVPTWCAESFAGPPTKTSGSNPAILLPPSSALPTPTVEAKTSHGQKRRKHSRKPTDYDAALCQLIGAEAAREFIIPPYPDSRNRNT